jgi:hypothetical protein
MTEKKMDSSEPIRLITLRGKYNRILATGWVPGREDRDNLILLLQAAVVGSPVGLEVATVAPMDLKRQIDAALERKRRSIDDAASTQEILERMRAERRAARKASRGEKK